MARQWEDKTPDAKIYAYMSNYTLFLDESGDHGLSGIDQDFPIFVLSGMLVENGAYTKLCQDLDALKVKHFGSKEVIMHSRDIRKCEGVFQALFDLEKKEAFYKDLNSFIEQGSYMLIASAILKQKHIETYGKLADDPYEIALTFVLERCLFQTEGNNRVQVVIESRGKKEDQQLAKRYAMLLGRGSGQVDASRFVGRFESKMISKLKRDNDCGLQVADLCAYPLARHVLSPEAPYPAYDIVEKKVRRGPHGIEGYGLKVFP